MATQTQTKTRNNNTADTTAKPAPQGNLPAAQGQKKPPAIVQFREYVQQRMATLEDALPPTIPPKRFVSVLMTALQTKPKLLDCTFQSLWNACVRAAQDGLLPDGREGAIAPYGENKDGKRVAEIATWMPMVEGYRKKIFEAGRVKSWEVNVVHEKDDFDYELGDNAFIRHKPYMGVGPAGGVVGAYSIAKLESGETVREVMSAFQISQVKAKSKAGNGPWQDAAFFPEMCKKVVARRHYKQLPHSESMDDMISRDDREHGLLDETTPAIAAPARRQLAARDPLDNFAGETIDNDTGEIVGDQQQQSTATSVKGDQVKGESGAGEAADAKSGASAAEPAEMTMDDGASGATEKTSESTAAATEGAKAETALPTNRKEFQAYFEIELAKIDEAPKVVAWFNSPEQKQLRETCETAPIFQDLLQLAGHRRNFLTQTAAGTTKEPWEQWLAARRK